MAIIKKYAEGQSSNLNPVPKLNEYSTFVVDSDPNSFYFRITEFKNTFTGGKNGFLIAGSEHLKESTEVKVQILDVEGNPVYYEPGNGIPEYYEGTSKLVAVYVYEDTPIGSAKITILGELKTYVDENGVTQPVPDEWKNVYNVKWEKEFQINKLLSNEDKVRFYRRPVVNIDEIVKPIFSNIVTTVTQKGRVDGFAQVPSAGQTLTDYTLPTSYLIQINDGGAWTGSIVGSTIEFTDLNFSSQADDLIDKTNLTIKTPYTINGVVSDFSNQRYTSSFNYVEGIDNLKTALTGSFAKIRIGDLTTFVGDVARVKIFRRSQSDLADYQFIQEIQLESNEVLRDLESTTKNEEFYGSFDQFNFKNYWITSSNNITTEFNQTFLYNSVKLNAGNSKQRYYTSKSLEITEDNEYTFDFNLRLQTNLSPNNYIKAFLSGSNNGQQVVQNIITVTSDNTILQKSNVTANFKAELIENPKLYFEVVGNGWHIADVSLRASQETSFSPDEITFIQPIPRTLPRETFDFRFQFYDINNNYIPVLVEESKTFDGGNLNVINKDLQLIPSSLYFQFDSGSGFGNPVPPTTIFIDVVKSYLTGSVNFTSRSFDFFNNELSQSQYTPGQFPGLLLDRTLDTVRLTVENFTGSREDIPVQFIEFTGECEGVTDTIVITRVVDGKGGVNFEIRPYRGTVIRNNDPSGSLEVQAIRIDGINELNLREGLPAGRSLVQLHVQSGSKYLLLSEASASGFVKGIYPGTSGSKEINYNAIFNRDSIDGQRTVFLIPSGSSNYSASILTTLTLTDLLDGIDAGFFAYDNDTFTINPRLSTTFTPPSASATASFYRRGTNVNPISASVFVFPSMSINKDYVPEYWMYYYTGSVNTDIKVSATDDLNNIIPSLPLGSYVSSPLTQSRTLTVTATYIEPYSSESVSVSKVFSIVPEGKPGDETIIYEVTPAVVNLNANSRGIVTSYSSSITNIKLKQGSRYLIFTASRVPGTFWTIPQSITGSNITPGNNIFYILGDSSSLNVSPASNMTELSASITYNIEIQPYYTSSVYTGSIIQQYNKTLEGAEPIQIIITPSSVNIKSDEVGYVTDYGAANTKIEVKEGNDFLRYNTSSLPGTWKINSVETRSPNGVWTIRTGSLVTGSASSSLGTFNRFDHPYVSASATYTIQVYPFALGAGHLYTSSIYTRTQTFNKAIAPPNARSVDFKATSYTVNYNRDGVKTTPEGAIDLIATAFNTTGSVYFYFYYVEADGSETFYDGPLAETSPGSKEQFISVDGADAAGPGENKTWKVKITDGKNPSYSSLVQGDVRAEGQLTISGIKAGADSYRIAPTNESVTISGDLWTRNLNGTGIKLPTFKGVTQLTNVNTPTYPAYTYPDDYDYLGNVIGKLGYSSASIFYKDNWITQSLARIPSSNPATTADLIDWRKWAVSQSATIVYKVDFENGRQTQFVTQSFSVAFTPPAPYNVYMQNENSSAVYRVSGELELSGTSNIIRAYRGDLELTNKPSGFTSPQWDAYDEVGYKEQCRVSISAKSGHIDLAGGLTAGSYITGTPASGPAVVSWTDPENNPTATIVYQIECEGRETLFKTQSISIQYEGATGPGIVMRGEWSNATDYIGSVETTNNRRDAVTYLATTDETHYYAAVSGSGPNTYVNPTTSTYYVGATPPAGFNLIGAQPPTVQDDNEYWQYLGQEEFFVAAKIAIFEESYVKNTINVGTKNGTGAFANIVIAGGRTDPYIAIGQNATVGSAGTAGTSLNPGGQVIGYDRPGIFLGIYEQGAAGTTGRFSIRDTTGNRYIRWDGTDLGMSGKLSAGGMELGTGVNSSAGNGLYLNSNNYWYDTGTNFKVGGPTNYLEWDGNTLTLRGSLKQTTGGVNEGRLMGAWASGIAYLTNDIVTYGGNTWTSNSNHTSTNNTNAGTGYPGYGPWTIAPISAKTLRMAASSQVFIEAKDGTLSPDWIEFSVNKQNISATTNWTTSPSVTLYNASSGGSTTTTGDTIYLRKADFGSNTLVEVTATADSLSDSISVARVQEGTDALTVILTNESHTLPAANDGTVSSYAGSGTDIYIYEGATQLDYDGVGTAAGKWTLSTAVSNITAGSVTDGGNYATIGNHSSMTADLASVTYTLSGKKLNGDSFSLNRVQSFSKSKQGAAGAAGATGPGVVYRGEYDAAVTYFFTTGVRRDIVKYNNAYYLTKQNTLGNLPTNTTYWESFGAQFSSVATDILLAQDATITRALVMGVETSGTGSGIIRSAAAATFNSGSGFYMDSTGRVRFGNPVGSQIKFEENNFSITGSISATDGKIGNWIIESQAQGGNLRDSGSKLILNPTVPELGFYLAGEKKLNISPVNYLTNVGGSNISVSDVPNGNGSPYPDWTTPADVSAFNTYATQYGPYSYCDVSNFETATNYTVPAGGTYAITGLYTFSVLQIDNLTSTTVYANANSPAYSGYYYGQAHYGYASSQFVGAEVYLEAVNQSTGQISRTLIQAVSSYSATNVDYWEWNGSTWTYTSVTNPGYHSGYTTGGFSAINNVSMTFPSAGSYKFRYSIRISARAGTAVSVDEDGVFLPEVYYNHTSGINTAATDNGIGYNNFGFTVVIPTNIVEVTTGGIQIANDTSTYVQMPRLSSVGSSDVIFEAKGAKSRFWAYGAAGGAYTNYSIESYGTMYLAGNVYMSGNDSVSGYGRLDLAYRPKYGSIYQAHFIDDVHPADTRWGTSGGPHNGTQDMGSNSSTGVYWDELYADNYNNLSDLKLKENIYTSDLGLDFINRLRPVKYNFISSTKKRPRYGFIAQEVLTALESIGKTSDDFKGLNTGSNAIKNIERNFGKPIEEIIASGSITGSDGTLYTQEWYDEEQKNAGWSITYNEFISPMVKAIQELSEKVQKLENEISGSLGL